MATLKETAQVYEPTQMKNVADLDKVPLGIKVEEKTFKEGTPDEFRANIITIEEDDYRVPNTVLKTIKELLGHNPALQFVKVLKSGEGVKTTYTVIPLGV